jgi:gas vesicle protein
MNTLGERPNVTSQTGWRASTFGYLAAGLGIGAAFSIFLAPKSGEETRKWIAGKFLNAVDTANEKVRKSRVQVREIVDRGQIQVSEAVAAGREAIGKHKEATS